MPLLDPNRTYTFGEIFNLRADTEQLLTELGYGFERQRLHLPQYAGGLDRLEDTLNRIEELLPYVSLANEQARREVLIAPVATDLVHYTKAKLRIEFTIAAGRFQGNLDYLLEARSQLLVIEAEQDDLTNGFNQLAVELIALDQWEFSPAVSVQPMLIGSVSTGNIWQFGTLNRRSKRIIQGLGNYRVPEDLELLLRILIQALTGDCLVRSLEQ